MTAPESAPAPTKPPQTALQKLWKEILEPIVFVPKYETWLHKAGVGDFKRGDILIFKPPHEASAKISNLSKNAFGLWTYRPFLIKRLIGLPGDRVSIAGGEVTVNGQQLDSSWTTAFWQAQGCWDTQSDVANNVTSRSILGTVYDVVPDRQEFTVPQGQYFVMGDNRTAGGSEDSRIMGSIPRRDVAGRAAAVVWPIMRKANVKYDCLKGEAPVFSGASELNWRILNRPAGFSALK